MFPPQMPPAAPPMAPMPPAAPAGPTGPPSLVSVQMPDADLKKLKTEITAAIDKSREDDSKHQQCLERYAPMFAKGWVDTYYDEVRTNLLYAILERKSADLFYKKPELTVLPSPLIDAMPNAAKFTATHAAIVNHALNSPEVNALDFVDRALLDYMLFGVGPVKVGYRAFTKNSVDPATGQATPVTMKSECFIESFSPKQLLIPKGWRSTNYEKAPWMGWRGEMPLRTARRVFQLPDDFTPNNKGSEQQHYSHGKDDTPVSPDMVQFTELSYKSAIYRDDAIHPDQLTQLVFVDGLETPVIHRDSPDQTLDAQGRLTADSLIGFPVDPMCLRVLTDSSRVQSDAAMMLPQVAELDIFRQQQVKHRDINMQRGFVNSDSVPKAEFEQAMRTPQGGMAWMPPEFFSGQNIKWVETPPLPPDNWQTEAHIKDDIHQITKITPNQNGAQETGQTATEASIRQENVNAALGKEQNRIAKWFIRIAEKLSVLKLRYLSVEDAAAIVGPQDAAAWDAGRNALKAIPNARVAFTMMPDSALRNDTPLERKQLQDLFTYLAQDPTVNRSYFVTQLLLRYHIDPTKAILPATQVPKPQPEPVIPGLSFKGDDFLNPAIVAMIQANPQWGIQVPAIVPTLAALTPQGPVDGQPPHPGKVPQLEGLDKHAADQTGGMSKTGTLLPSGGPPSTVQ